MSAVSTPTPPDITRQAQTRLRLLEAAAREFAEHGFHHATVRDICKRAEANVAAVNYHFGDKEGLYTATLEHWVGVALEQFPLLMNVPEAAPAEERLRGFIRGTLFRMLHAGAPGWHGQLMAREMVEPTAALDQVIAGTLKPMCDMVHGIVREIVGPKPSDDEVRACAMSVIGQCCLYKHARAVVTRMYGPEVYSEQGIEALADHVTRFSLAAMRSLTNDDARMTSEG
jgi:TetR/AcrR family transcriptional regulator, regulator of cefoperazone and chloramphenicol sensitivity